MAGLLATGGFIAYIDSGARSSGPPVVWTESEKYSLPVGSQAVDVNLPQHGGGHVSLSALKGQSVGLAFVSARCPYCDKMQQEMESLEPLELEGLYLVCGSASEAEEVRVKYSHNVPVLVDSARSVFRGYRVQGVPTVYLIDFEGKVESVNRGWPSTWLKKFSTMRRFLYTGSESP